MASDSVGQTSGNAALSGSRTQVMAVLNLTPDSFSDGGQLYRSGKVDLDKVLSRAADIADEGADWFDLGGESTRPGAEQISSAEECDRVLPVVDALRREFALPISVDTSNPELMTAAAGAGAAMINDVRALQREGALTAAINADLPVCLMHMQGTPHSMQEKPEYQNVADEVSAYLLARAHACEQAGMTRANIVLDPGFGFGKTLEHNLALFNGLPALVQQGYPVLVGVSRKSMIGSILSKQGKPRDVDERLAGGLALATLAAVHRVAIIRTHDVRATRDIVEVVQALNHSEHKGQKSSGETP